MRLCAAALVHAQTVAQRCSRAAAGEVELGVTLLRTGFSGAQTNLEMRLGTLTDVVYTCAIVDEIAGLSEQAMSAANAAKAFVRVPPA